MMSDNVSVGVMVGSLQIVGKMSTALDCHISLWYQLIHYSYSNVSLLPDIVPTVMLCPFCFFNVTRDI